MANYAETLNDIGKNPYETVVIIGTGVVENGWEALRAAVERAIANGPLTVGPIHPIAYTIFSLRILANGGYKDHDAFKQKVDTINRIRTSIRDTFSEFKKDNKLRLRITEDGDYVEKLQRGKTLIITTNWDALLEDYYVATKRFSVLSLHGNIKDHPGIYLPTEISIDAYHEHTPSHGFMVQAHGICIRALENAKRIVVWGNSLDFTDAELCVLLGDTHVHGKTKDREYIVVDPSKNPLERLRFLTGVENVHYIDPTAV